jgi:hypothetical protein
VVCGVRNPPKLKKRTALLRKLKDVFRRHQSQPLDQVIKLINPMLRGWVAYFAVGNSSECFAFIKDDTRKRKSEPTVNTNFDLNRRASARPYL